jgi:hypothetical protein
MASSSARLVFALGAVLLCLGTAGCSGQQETELEKLEHSTENNETLNIKVATIPLGTPIAAVKAKMGPAERYEAANGTSSQRIEYLHYGQWQLNFADGKLVAVYKYKP